MSLPLTSYLIDRCYATGEADYLEHATLWPCWIIVHKWAFDFLVSAIEWKEDPVVPVVPPGKWMRQDSNIIATLGLTKAKRCWRFSKTQFTSVLWIYLPSSSLFNIPTNHTPSTELVSHTLHPLLTQSWSPFYLRRECWDRCTRIPTPITNMCSADERHASSARFVPHTCLFEHFGDHNPDPWLCTRWHSQGTT
jgi:hypothetical protein